MDHTAQQRYLVRQIMSATPAGRVAMLYDRAIGLLNEAIDAIEAGEIERRWRCNSKAVEVVSHLWETLDMEQGGKIATNLGELYEFMIGRLTAVDVANDAQAARDVIRLLEPLRRSWHTLAEAEAPRPEPVAAPHTSRQISLSA